MRSMADPNYTYQPWTAERRLRASLAAKERCRNHEGDAMTIANIMRKSYPERQSVLDALMDLIRIYGADVAKAETGKERVDALHNRALLASLLRFSARLYLAQANDLMKGLAQRAYPSG